MVEATKTTCCCCGGSEESLLELIKERAAEYKGREGSLIQVLHMAQGIYGYLPLEVQKVVADALRFLYPKCRGWSHFIHFLPHSGGESIRSVSVLEPHVMSGEERKLLNGSRIFWMWRSVIQRKTGNLHSKWHGVSGGAGAGHVH